MLDSEPSDSEEKEEGEDSNSEEKKEGEDSEGEEKQADEEKKHDSGPDLGECSSGDRGGSDNEEPDTDESEAAEPKAAGMDTDWRDPSMEAIENVVTKFAKMMLEGIAHDRLTQTGADFVLDCLHDSLLHLCAPVLRECVPHDWRTLKTLADFEEQKHWYEHFCPKNHHRFSRTDKDDEHCPKCNSKTRYKPGVFLV